MDSHLRSTEAIMGYHIEAADGEIGHVNGFIVDDEVGHPLPRGGNQELVAGQGRTRLASVD